MKENILLGQHVLATLSDHIAVINQSGIIVAVNQAWEDFALENGITSLHRADRGSNYFEVCCKSIENGDGSAGLAMAGIKSVFRKEQPSFEFEYPCDSPFQKRWFIMNAVLMKGDDTMLVSSHHDITERKIAEQSIAVNPG